MSTLKADSVISELWAVRDANSARFNHDPVAICRDIRSLEGSFDRAAAHYASLAIGDDTDGENHGSDS
ncbi:MAG: hypothetical protein OXI95_02915 [bacterium]|nr:hypothetical protein [Rhodospirillaceae bacterium]MDE0415874.1 hypothetical protein [bacterium]